MNEAVCRSRPVRMLRESSRLGIALALVAVSIQGCGDRAQEIDDFFILRHPGVGEGAPVIAMSELYCPAPFAGEIALGCRWGAEVWIDGEPLTENRRKRPRPTHLDQDRIPLALSAGSHHMVIRFLNGPPPAPDSTGMFTTDAGLVLSFADPRGKALPGLAFVAPGGVPGYDTWALAPGLVGEGERSAGPERGWQGIPRAPRPLADPEILMSEPPRPFRIDPVPVVMTVDEIRDYPLSVVKTIRGEDVAAVVVDWSRALPDSIRAVRIERTASWHHRLPFRWTDVEDARLAKGLVEHHNLGPLFADRISLNPASWPWTLGDGMGRIITYRITPEPPCAVDWTAPRLVSVLVLAPGFHGLADAEERLWEEEIGHPDLVSLEVIGRTAGSDERVLAARVTAPGADGSRESKPAVLVVGDIHAREPFGIEICVDLVSELAGGYESDPEITRLLDAAELWVVPALNAGAWAYLSEGFPGYLRTNLADLNGDGVCTPAPLYPIQWPGEPLLEPALDHIYFEGVDLNRNFAPHWDLGTSAESGSAEPGGQRYRGPSPFSEPETQAIRDLALRERFVFSLFYHEPGENFHFLRDTPDEDVLTAVAGRLGRAARKRPGDWGGSSLGFMYYEAGTIDFTVEGARDARGDAEWLLAPRASARDSVSAHHRGIVRELLRLAAATGLHGRVLDGEDGPPVQAKLEIRRQGEDAVRRLHTNATGSFHRYLLPGAYTVRARCEESGASASRRFEIAAERPTRLELVLETGREAGENRRAALSNQ